MVLPIIKLEISANSVAWYGAILGTASLVISYLNYLKDKLRIRVKMSQGWFTYSGSVSDEVQIILEAQNHGKRPISINSYGFILSDKSTLVYINQQQVVLPFELKEGKSLLVPLERKELISKLKPGIKIKFGYFTDSIGNIYKVKFNKKFYHNI